MPILSKSTKTVAVPRSRPVGEDDAWIVLSWVGLAFIVMGVTDISLGWYPSQFGNPEWEFGAISSALNGFALPTLGIYLMLAAALARGQKAAGRILAILMLLMAISILGLALTYVTVIPLALNSVEANALLAAGMQKAIFKGGTLFIAYESLLVLGAVRGWGAGRTEE